MKGILKQMAAKKTTGPTKRAASQPKFIRNLLYTHVTLRAQERRIDLAPRGQRGDIVPLKKGDQADENFMTDHKTLFEVITKAEAESARDKQMTNATRQHPAMANIRNELGEAYPEGAIRVEEEHNAQGVTVAKLNDEGNVQIERGVGIVRAPLAGTQDNPIEAIPDSIAPEEQADFRKNLKVTVEPTQKT